MKIAVLPALIAMMCIGGAAFAQGPGGPPDGGGPGGPPPFGEPGQGGPGFGGPGRGGPGMGGRGRQMRPVTAATVPTKALAHYLKLSATQEQKIQSIAEKLRSERPRPPMPPQGGNEGGQFQPPSREEMDAMRQKMQALESRANQSVAAILTGEQKKKLPGILKAFSALRAGHIRLDAADKMNLTPAQITRLAALGTRADEKTVVAGFSKAQLQIASQNRRQPGQRPMGGPPEGGPEGGFPGGGPPPGGGPGGPPEGGF